jgi:hypothetical protein
MIELMQLALVFSRTGFWEEKQFIELDLFPDLIFPIQHVWF